MSRWSTLLLCGLAFAGGLVAGTRESWWPRATAATAPQPGVVESAATTQLMESSMLLARIARLTTGSVVHIQSEHRSTRGRLIEETGSGVIIESPKAKGTFVVSNRHVVGEIPLENISIHLHDGRVLHPTKILSDKATDIAVMKINAPDLVPARWGDSDKAEIGHLVLALGSPFGLSQSVTLGIISAKGRRSLKLGETSDMLNQDFLQTDAAINPGNSGGPLIDMQGLVIGINTAIASNSGGNEGIGFSIPSNLVRRVVEQLLEHGKVTRAYLGVKLDPDFNVDTAAKLKLDRVRGARILEVYPNTPAARAQLLANDVVLTFDGIEVQDENHLINLVSLTPVGNKVKVVLFREGRHVTIEVAVGDRSQLEQPRAEAPSEPGMGTRIETLGLSVHELDDDLAGQLGYEPSTRGLLVLKIDKNSPMGSDLRLYDLIEEVARRPVPTLADLDEALRAAAENDTVLLMVKRRVNNQTQSEVLVYHR